MIQRDSAESDGGNVEDCDDRTLAELMTAKKEEANQQNMLVDD